MYIILFTSFSYNHNEMISYMPHHHRASVLPSKGIASWCMTCREMKEKKKKKKKRKKRHRILVHDVQREITSLGSLYAL
jgi:thiol:disulfide interchange protein